MSWWWWWVGGSGGEREGGDVVDSGDDGHAGDAAGVRRGCGDGGGERVVGVGDASGCHLSRRPFIAILDPLCSIWILAFLSVNSGMSLIYITQNRKPAGQCSSILLAKTEKGLN